MSTINGKACIVNGTPVDKVFSDGKQVYGRNLLKNTFDYASGWSFSNQALTEILEADGTPTKIIKFNYNPSGWVGIYQTFINWPVRPKAGDTVTLSFYAKGNGRIYSAIEGIAGSINTNATSEWKLYNLTGVATKEIVNVSIYLHNIVTTATHLHSFNQA